MENYKGIWAIGPMQNLLNRKIIEGWGDTYYGNFGCNDWELISLEGAPSVVHGNFYCDNNQLTSLKGSPRWVWGDFQCSRNKLTTLEGAPIEVGGDLVCDDNPIESLAGIGSYFKNGYIEGLLVIPGSVRSHMLGILLIPELRDFRVTGLTDINLFNATKIIKKHLNGDRDILECQEELRSAGLREYGKL